MVGDQAMKLAIVELQEEHVTPCAEITPQIEPWVTLGADVAKMEAYFRRLLGTGEAFVALVGDEVVGFVTITMGFLRGGYIRRLAVKKEYRGQGIGAQIMTFIEKHISASYSNVFLCVSASNPRARSFYQKLGYQIVGELPDLIVENDSEYLLRKVIAQA